MFQRTETSSRRAAIHRSCTIDVNTPQDDNLLFAALSAPVECQAIQICHQGTQKAAKQKYTFDFVPADGEIELIPDESWTGTWDTNMGSMDLQMSGNSVTGTYPHDQDRIQGTISGNKLIGTWSEAPSYSPPNDAGDLEFVMSDDRKSFSGNWRYGSNGGWSGSWLGTR